MSRIDVEQNSQEWLEYKQNTIGSSEAAAAVGLSRWCTPKDFLWHKKHNTILEQSDYMRLGHEYEELIAQAFAERMGIGVLPEPMYIHPYIKWLSASPDRRHVGDGGLFIEIKFKVYDTLPNLPELEHLCQLQHQMFVLSQPCMYIVYGSRDLKLRVFLVDRNPHFYQHEIYKKLLLFHKCWKGTETELPYTSTVHEWSADRIQKTFNITLIHV